MGGIDRMSTSGRRRVTMWRMVCALVACGAATMPPAAWAEANDFPTAARVDYVIGCMAANGQDQLVMSKCSCSIDYIAERMSFAEYTEIETIKRMRLVPGERAGVFRDVPRIRDALDRFQLLQVEADLQCF